ncbi:MAG: hypothetical protein PVG66_12455 [Chromatiales bacterium]|jgi:hypothetical protein
MKGLKFTIVLFALLLLVGCASVPQPPVPLTNDYWEKNDPQLGIYVKPLEKPQFYMEGDVRLLDYAVNAAVMSPVTSHFESLEVTDYDVLREDIKQYFSDQGKQVKLLVDDLKISDLSNYSDPDKEDTVYFAKKDYTGLKKKYGIDHLLVVIPERVGLARPYQGFIPMGEPRAIFEVKGELVDLETNQLLWYAEISRDNFSSGVWDEPPTYPGLTNGFYAALEAIKQDVLNHLQKKAEKQAKLDIK